MASLSIKTVGLVVGAVVTVGLAAYAVNVVLGGGELEVLDGLLAQPEPETDEGVDERRERLAAMARGISRPPTDSVFEDPEEPAPQMQPGELTPQDARAGFDYVMRQVERMGSKRQRLSQQQWQETWRTANDAYAALSIELDGSDPGELAELEEAHRRLKKGLRRVRVRGGKFNAQ